jgi:hypothetical protein
MALITRGRACHIGDSAVDLQATDHRSIQLRSRYMRLFQRILARPSFPFGRQLFTKSAQQNSTFCTSKK